MKIKDSNVKVGVPANESDFETQFQHALFIEPLLDKDILTAKDLANASSLQRFMKNNCHSSSCFSSRIKMHGSSMLLL